MRRSLALVLATVAASTACSERTSQPPAAALPLTRATVVPRTTKQLVTAVVDDWAATKATLRLWQRGVTGSPLLEGRILGAATLQQEHAGDPFPTSDDRSHT